MHEALAEDRRRKAFLWALTGYTNAPNDQYWQGARDAYRPSGARVDCNHPDHCDTDYCRGVEDMEQRLREGSS